MHYYKSDNINTTTSGALNIQTKFERTSYKGESKSGEVILENKHITSGMLQSWQKFCFTGGVIEVAVRLPGKGSAGGLWPAVWMMGDLARGTYVGSTDYIWPWSYSSCPSPNSPAMKSGTSTFQRGAQEINACKYSHHYGLSPFVGRGAPEIDILEAMPGESTKLPMTNITKPYASMSYQVSPGIGEGRPQVGEVPKTNPNKVGRVGPGDHGDHGDHHGGHASATYPDAAASGGLWYSGMSYGVNASLNPFFYGFKAEHKDEKGRDYQTDAISANAQLNEGHFQDFHIYRVEWSPSSSSSPTLGSISWYLDGAFKYSVSTPNLSITGAQIPSEPMSLLLNVAVSRTWGFPAPCPDNCDCTCLKDSDINPCDNDACGCALPAGFCENLGGDGAGMEVDWVRVWQTKAQKVGCHTEERPTRLFIEGHKKRYMEVGDKQPLKPVQRGGAPCNSGSKLCGSQGHCNGEGLCACEDGFTGPRCLSRDYYEDDPFDPASPPDFKMSAPYAPLYLRVLLAAITVGVLWSYGRNVRMFKVRRKEMSRGSYQEVSAGGGRVSTSAELAVTPVVSNTSTHQNQK